jgi:uncharacterized protein (TIGR02594 family)
MKVNKGRGTLVICSIAVMAASSAAFARPIQHHHKTRHWHAAVSQAAQPVSFSPESDQRYSNVLLRSRVASKSRRQRAKGSVRSKARPVVTGASTSNDLVAEARKYIGTNPTGRRSLWCGAFMDLVLKETGHKGGGNLAMGYLRYGPHVAGPQVGAIAVMGRRGGGHVGVVSGIDPNGNPIIISGNHNHTTAESVYPRKRIVAYVVPTK